MSVNGRELLPCIQGHLQGVPVPGSPGIAYCGACGSRYDRSLPVNLDKLCRGHGGVGRHGASAWRRCGSVAEHMAWEKQILESGRPRRWFDNDRLSEGVRA